MKIEQIPIETLIPYALNARTHSDTQVAQIAASIKEFGFNNPVLIDSESGIIAGHGRVLAARKLCLSIIPCVRIGHLSEAKKRAYVIADNKLALNAGWDDAMLKIELEALASSGFDMSITGFDEDELKKLLAFNMGNDGETDPDEVPEAPESPKSEPGKLYHLGPHRVVCGDSTKDIPGLLGDGRPTLVFTDPPYGVSIGDKNKMLNQFKKHNWIVDNIAADTLRPEELKIILSKVFVAVKKHMADECSVFVCSPQGGGLGMMMMMMQESGLEVRHILNWVKNSPTFSMGRLDYDYQHEPILFTWGKKHKKIMAGNFKTSVWAVNKPQKCGDHPTMKPVELPVNAILNHTDPGDVVLDPFLGSGTTLIASEKTGRVCMGIELEPKYVDVIRKRWAEFVHGKGCDWEVMTPETK